MADGTKQQLHWAIQLDLKLKGLCLLEMFIVGKSAKMLHWECPPWLIINDHNLWYFHSRDFRRVVKMYR